MNFNIKMPTIGIQPSLATTQAVAAVLMHQFARERFLEAGLSEDILREAEARENVDSITSNLLLDTSANSSCTEQTDINNLSGVSTSANGSQSDRNLSNALQTSQLEHSGGEQFHSIAESSCGNDRTIYHSMNAGRPLMSSIDRVQMLHSMSTYGQELRRIAEDFEKSQLRQDIKRKAEQISLTDINKETFRQLLEELFQGGVTRVKVVTLFFFCTDVALKAATLTHELVVKLMGWSFSYIINTVGRFVHELGGWDHVLFWQIPSLLITCCAALGICAIAILLRKSLRA